MANTKQDQGPQAMDALMQVIGETLGDLQIEARKNVDIQYSGKAITLPAKPKKMSIPDAISVLTEKHKESEEMVGIHEPIDAFPWDGANAFMLAMKQVYGWTRAVPTHTWFGDIPPDYRTIETGPDTKTQVIWGRFTLPGIEGELATSATKERGKFMFVISGEVKKKDQEEVKRLADLTRQIVKEQSIYKGKAFELVLDEKKNLVNYMEPPAFLRRTNITDADIILSAEVQELVNTNIYTPVRYTELCRKNGIPLNRGALMEGRFGVGKTMIATALSRICVEHGWTFILCPKAMALESAIKFALPYQPAVVFAEDIDKAVGQHRDDTVDKILNVVDGVSSKDVDIMVVLTTNEIEKINQAMLRPGRMDAVISILPPDAEAVTRLIRKYGGSMLAQDADLTQVGTLLEGKIPSVIREVVDRSKLHAIGHGNVSEDGRPIITPADLLGAGYGMQEHLKMLQKHVVEPTLPERFAGSLADVIDDQVARTLQEHPVTEKVNKIAAKFLDDED